MRLTARLVLTFAAVLAGIVAQQPQATGPSLMGCGIHGEIEVICGTRQPEDLERTPDGKFLIATQYLNQGRGATTSGGMILFAGQKILQQDTGNC